MTELRIAGPYFEACNCDAICSCRMVDGRSGSRAQYRYCQFAIGWSVTEASVLDVKGGPFEFSYEGRCGFVASFDYRSD